MENSIRISEHPTVRTDKSFGKRGWLLLLILILMIIEPIRALYNVWVIFQVGWHLEPSVADELSFLAYGILQTIVISINCALGAASGYLLLKGTKKKDVEKASQLLWIGGPVLYIAAGAIYPIFIPAKNLSANLVVSQVVSSFLFVLMIDIYLARSRRVQNTYEGDLSDFFKPNSQRADRNKK